MLARSGFVALLVGASLAFVPAAPAESSPESSREAQVARIQAELEKLRGVAFERPVAVRDQSAEGFEQYVRTQLRRQLPADAAKSYGKVVEKLGLYRGPRIEDFEDVGTQVMTTQAAAYYDPAQNAFFVVKSDLGAALQGPLYAHELYHGLQDQRHDLEGYLLSQVGGQLNEDELRARQAVVEGEAMYAMTLWTLSQVGGAIPPREQLGVMIELQAGLDTDTMRQMLGSEAATAQLGDDVSAAVAALDVLPGFLVESLMGAYMKGMRFVFQVQGEGWGKVDELYTNPPVSTEQILHPEKWLSGEGATRYTWPGLADVAALQGWSPLATNVLGELLLRSVFTEHGVANGTAARVAAGWNGDAYAVLERTGSGELLLLWRTSWDTPEDAAEFAAAYAALLETKYPDGAQVTKLVQRDRDVLIVEGGSAADTDAYLDLLGSLEGDRPGRAGR